MVIWRKVEQEEWLALIEKKIIDLDKRLLQAEDIILRLLTQSHSLAEVIEKEARLIFKRQEQFKNLEMIYEGVNLLMITNIYVRLTKLATLIIEGSITKKLFKDLYNSLSEAYEHLLNNIENHLNDKCPLYLHSEEIPNAIIVNKTELNRYRLKVEV